VVDPPMASMGATTMGEIKENSERKLYEKNSWKNANKKKITENNTDSMKSKNLSYVYYTKENSMMAATD